MLFQDNLLSPMLSLGASFFSNQVRSGRPPGSSPPTGMISNDGQRRATSGVLQELHKVTTEANENEFLKMITQNEVRKQSVAEAQGRHAQDKAEFWKNVVVIGAVCLFIGYFAGKSESENRCDRYHRDHY